MNRKVKSLAATMLAVVMAVSCFVGTIPVSNAEYFTFDEASASYKSGPYYTALTKVEKTGDYRTDIINIAISQIGYQEAESTGQYSGTVLGGNNYTEYGRWFGVDGGQWCAMFVSWCAYVAGVSSAIVPQHSYTENGASFFISRNQCYDWSVVKAGIYAPERGDVVYFYSGTAGRTVTHVGLVEKFENGILYTIEGNTSSATFTTDGGCCCRRTYTLNDTKVKYICRPNYGSTDTGVEAPTDNGYYTSTGYYVTSGGLNVRNIPSSTAAGTTVVTSMSAGTAFECLEVVKDTDTSKNKYWAKILIGDDFAYTSLNSANVIYYGDSLPQSLDPYSLETNKTQYYTGEMIYVTVNGTRAADWIGVYKKGENSDVDNGGVKAIYYAKLTDCVDGSIIINGAYDNLGSGGRSDAADFANGLPKGEYTIKYFKNGSYDVAKTVDISVVEGTVEDIEVPLPQWSWDFGQQPHYAPGMTTTKTDDYVTLSDKTGDGWIWPGNSDNLGNNPINLDNSKIAVIKLRVTSGSAEYNQIELLAKAGAIVSYTSLANTSGWQYVIFDCSESSLAGQWAGTQTWFRIDPVNRNGSVCDLDWIAFFKTKAEANEFAFADRTGLINDLVVDTKGSAVSFGNTGNATIKLYREGNTTASFTKVIAENNGTYTFTDVPVGVYTMEVSKANHVTRKYVVEIGYQGLTQDIKIYLLGDLNGDGSITTVDAARANGHAKGKTLLEGYTAACADINGDGEITTIDPARINGHAKRKTLLW